MSKKLIIIGKDDCIFCTNAKHLSAARKIDYTYLNCPNDISKIEAFKMAGQEFSTFPAIFIVNEEDGSKDWVGGFSEYRLKANKIKSEIS